MNSKKLVLLAITCLIFSILVLSCNKDNATEPEKEIEATITDIAGSWSGTTSQNKPLAFTVLSESEGVNKITYFKITIRFSSSEVMSEVSGLNSYVTKDKHDFLVYIPGYSTNPSISITGIFTSNNKSNGTFTSGSTSGTWTANK